MCAVAVCDACQTLPSLSSGCCTKQTQLNSVARRLATTFTSLVHRLWNWIAGRAQTRKGLNSQGDQNWVCDFAISIRRFYPAPSKHRVTKSGLGPLHEILDLRRLNVSFEDCIINVIGLLLGLPCCSVQMLFAANEETVREPRRQSV